MGKKLYESKGVWGAVLVVLAGLSVYFLPDYNAVLNVVSSVGLGLGIYGVRDAQGGLE